LSARRHILVIRFSAMGDVAMCVPVLRCLLQAHPDLQVTFVSQRAFAPIFEGIDRLHFFPADLKTTHRGIGGMIKLHRQLRILGPFDGVADLHQVLRTAVLGILFRLRGLSVAVIDKGRREKKALTRRTDKIKVPLSSSFLRYVAVFNRLGYPLDLEPTGHMGGTIHQPASSDHATKRIGIAPFAKHIGKTWPHVRMRQVVETLSQRGDMEIYLFGGGPSETEILNDWSGGMSHVHSLVGKYPLKEELEIIYGLDLMVSMDSANMHLASIFGVPVVSIWGATHPFAGFLGWGQHADQVIQADMDCRPCSVFGNKPCYKGTYECMTSISAEMVVKKILTTLSMK
jgi:ADP-heptose:LPS heptosyltransferase